MLVIVGGAACVWRDYKRVDGEHDLMTVNDITMHFPAEIHHAYSNSREDIERWVDCRRDTLIQAYGQVGQVHSLKDWPWTGRGSSGLGATLTGLALGYDRIILCGIPMDGSPHYFDPPWMTSNVGLEDMKHWKKHDLSKVRSFSGRTREHLGSP